MKDKHFSFLYGAINQDLITDSVTNRYHCQQLFTLVYCISHLSTE